MNELTSKIDEIIKKCGTKLSVKETQKRDYRIIKRMEKVNRQIDYAQAASQMYWNNIILNF